MGSKQVAYDDTKVSVGKSRADVSALLERKGIEGVQWTTWPDGRSILRFSFGSDGAVHMARLTISPREQGRKFDRWKPRARGPVEKREADHWEHEARRLHRTLFWYVKAKLEAIEAGLETPAQAWLAAIEGPRGHTVYQEMEQGLRAMKPGDFSTLPMLPPAPESEGE